MSGFISKKWLLRVMGLGSQAKTFLRRPDWEWTPISCVFRQKDCPGSLNPSILAFQKNEK